MKMEDINPEFLNEYLPQIIKNERVVFHTGYFYLNPDRTALIILNEVWAITFKFDDIRFKIKSNAMYSVTFTSRYSLSHNDQTIKEIQAYIDIINGMVGSILLNFNIIGSHEIFEMLL